MNNKYLNQAIRAYNEANDFFDLASYADKKSFGFSIDGLGEKYAAARNANLTFACELYFKSLFYLNEHNPRKYGHLLLSLFNNLMSIDKDTCKEIESLYSTRFTPITPFIELLTKQDNSFKEWRYYFEPQNKKIEFHITDMGILARTLKSICEERIKT